MKNLPEKIYLQLGDYEGSDFVEAMAEDHVSFQNERIHESDIEYVLNRWIPFEERQPEPGQLVAFLSEKISKPWAGVYYSNTEEFYASNSTYMNASHWLPLPEPPVRRS
jgi:hypothetical protein